MIVDLNHSPPPDTPQDVVIVGGGTVALLLAVLLERQGQRVLVLETGGGGFESPAQELNDATVIGRAHTGIAVARGRALGGTSNLWGGQLTGFVPSDFEARAGVSDAPWPISYQDLLPWYEAVARELRLADVLDEHTPQARKLFGEHFPDTAPALAGADSIALLERAAAMVRAAGFSPVNVDCSARYLARSVATCMRHRTTRRSPVQALIYGRALRL